MQNRRESRGRERRTDCLGQCVGRQRVGTGSGVGVSAGAGSESSRYLSGRLTRRRSPKRRPGRCAARSARCRRHSRSTYRRPPRPDRRRRCMGRRSQTSSRPPRPRTARSCGRGHEAPQDVVSVPSLSPIRYSAVPTCPAANPPNACDSAVRCGTAVSGRAPRPPPTCRPVSRDVGSSTLPEALPRRHRGETAAKE